VIEQHGGAIAVASEEGEGSTFAVSLPIDLRGSQRAAAHAAAPPAGG
jgi:signal transduction histidine kinase